MVDDDYFVHESSYVDSNVKIGSGSKIWHFSHLNLVRQLERIASLVRM